MQEGGIPRGLKRKNGAEPDAKAKMERVLRYSSGKQENGGKHNGETVHLKRADLWLWGQLCSHDPHGFYM